MTAELLLSKLDKVRRTGPGTWLACCPAHEDRTASLSIKDADEKTLLHCFGQGCSAAEIVAAVGLEISDLFPPRQHHSKPERRPFPAMDVLRALAFESIVVAALAKAVADGKAITPADTERAILAASRINAGLSAAAPILRGVRHE